MKFITIKTTATNAQAEAICDKLDARGDVETYDLCAVKGGYMIQAMIGDGVDAEEEIETVANKFDLAVTVYDISDAD